MRRASASSASRRAAAARSSSAARRASRRRSRSARASASRSAYEQHITASCALLPRCTLLACIAPLVGSPLRPLAACAALHVARARPRAAPRDRRASSAAPPPPPPPIAPIAQSSYTSISVERCQCAALTLACASAARSAFSRSRCSTALASSSAARRRAYHTVSISGCLPFDDDDDDDDGRVPPLRPLSMQLRAPLAAPHAFDVSSLPTTT
jgi:hypothetical protein